MPPRLYDEIDGEIKEGGLRKMLKLKKDEKFKITELRKLAKIEKGEKFKFHDKEFKMTDLMKKRIVLAINMMKK
jgi:hypothetical protein